MNIIEHAKREFLAAGYDPVEQARQAERILNELVAASPRRSLRCALARYNGGDKPKAVSYRYADKVLKVRKSLG